MKNTYLFLSCITLLSLSLSAQTWTHGYVLPYRHVNDVYISSSDVILTAGGNQQNDAIEGVSRSQNYGNSWEILVDTPITAWLKDLHFISDSIGFAAGFEGKIRKTNNMGTTWSPLNSGITRNLNGIFFTNSQTGFCAGGERTEPNQTIIKTTNAGQSWNVVHDAADFWLNDIYFIDQYTGVAVGDSGVALYSDDAGDSWQPITMPLVRHYHSIHFVDESTGYIAGGNFENSTILKSIDGGYSWYVIKDEQGGELRDIYFIDENVGYAVGTKGAFLKTTDGGDNWTQLVIPGLTSSVILNTVVFKNEQFGIAVGQWGEYFLLKLFQPILVETSAVTSSPEGTVNFTCMVNTNGSTGSVSVIYSTDPELTSALQTSSLLVNSITLTPVTFSAPDFQANTVYYYTCNASNFIQNFQGDTLSFFNYPTPVVETQDATVNFDGSVDFTCKTNTFGSSCAVSVLYGNDPELSNPSETGVTLFASSILTSVTIAHTNFTPNTIQYYTCKVSNFLENFSGDTLSFNYLFPAVVETDTAIILPNGTVEFTCMVNTQGTTNSVSVIYGIDPELNTPIETANTFVNTNVSTPISISANTFTPNVVYYFVCKSSNSLQNHYGDTLGFQYIFNAPDILSLPSTAVNPTSSILNGSVNNLYYPADISFEYSTVGGSVFTIPSTPSFINSTAYYSVSATATNLLPNTVYVYRVKAINTLTQTAEYSDYTYVHTGVNTIPNFDFEEWIDVSGVSLDIWKNVYGPVERVTGYSGNYAVKIERTQDAVGVLWLGYLEGLISSIGFPYNGRPDSIQVMLKRNILPGDTGYVLLQLKYDGQIIGENLIPITGNSSGIFELFKHKINYTSSETPDELVMAFVCSNILNPSAPTVYGSSIVLDDVRFPGNYPQPPNPGFENWDPVSYFECDNWTYIDHTNFGFYDNTADYMVTRTNDAQNGSYAIRLKNIMLDNNPELIIEGEFRTEAPNNPMSLSFDQNPPSFAVYHKPRALNGFFKFDSHGNDILQILCKVYSQGVNIATGEISITSTVDTYIPFNLKLSYHDDLLEPDSAFIKVRILNQPGNNLQSEGYIDNLRFDGFTNDFPISQPKTPEPEKEPFVLLYPNPGKEVLNIEMQNMESQTARIEIMDISGRKIYSAEKVLNENAHSRAEINTTAFQQGMYLVKVTAGKTLKSLRWVKLQ